MAVKERHEPPKAPRGPNIPTGPGAPYQMPKWKNPHDCDAKPKPPDPNRMRPLPDPKTGGRF